MFSKDGCTLQRPKAPLILVVRNTFLEAVDPNDAFVLRRSSSDSQISLSSDSISWKADDSSSDTHLCDSSQQSSQDYSENTSDTASGQNPGSVTADGHPSMGSVGHDEGNCKPCCFYKKAKCVKGAACKYCHYPKHDISPVPRPGKQTRDRLKAKAAKEAMKNLAAEAASDPLCQMLLSVRCDSIDKPSKCSL